MADDKSYLPDPAEVIKTIAVTPVGVTAEVGGPPPPVAFRILRTTEMDPYDAPLPAPVIAASAELAAATGGDTFQGHDRKAAKLSIANADLEQFDDLAALLDSLDADSDMVALDIHTDEASDRVDEEERNVRVKAWLYAASREKDNDFHLIIGRDPETTPRRYMTVEISGLPSGGPALSKLRSARTSFKNIVQQQTPGLGYDFYDPPIAVTVQGSLFFDATHGAGTKPGPSKTKPKTIWEIHPVTSIRPRTV